MIRMTFILGIDSVILVAGSINDPFEVFILHQHFQASGSTLELISVGALIVNY